MNIYTLHSNPIFSNNQKQITHIITTKAQGNDVEGISDIFEEAFNGKARKQHIGEMHGNENLDNEGDASPVENIVENKNDITTTTTIDEEDNPGFV